MVNRGMKIIPIAVCILLAGMLIPACGKKGAKDINVTLSYAAADNPYDPANGVKDLIYFAEDLDEPKALVYPERCNQSPAFAVGCGYTIDQDAQPQICFESGCNSSNPEAFIGPDHRAHLIFCARDEAGVIIFRGVSSEFYNDPLLAVDQSVTINVARVSIVGSCL